MTAHVIIGFDGRDWGPAQRLLSDGPPFEQVREFLCGRWTRSTGHITRDGVAAFWNETNGRRVLVMTAGTAQRLLA